MQPRSNDGKPVRGSAGWSEKTKELWVKLQRDATPGGVWSSTDPNVRISNEDHVDPLDVMDEHAEYGHAK